MEMTGSHAEKRLTVTTELGLHARVATSIARKLQNFVCEVTLVKDGMEADARSVLGLLLLAATPGSEVTVRAEGPDSQEAITEITRLLEDE
ncbi:MAG: HPr family phosphocarrier protein [Thermodesulfobacteriota bacterium]